MSLKGPLKTLVRLEPGTGRLKDKFFIASSPGGPIDAEFVANGLFHYDSAKKIPEEFVNFVEKNAPENANAYCPKFFSSGEKFVPVILNYYKIDEPLAKKYGLRFIYNLD